MNPIRTPKKHNIDDESITLLTVLMAAIILLLVITASYFIVVKSAEAPPISEDNGGTNTSVGSVADYPFRVNISVSTPNSDDSEIIEIDMNSEYAALVDVRDGKVIASKRSTTVIYPASMTKVMSLIVIAENLKSEAALNDKITITQDLYNRKVSEKHSGELNTVGEVLTVKDLIYAFILNSDGVAGIALAQYISGSEAAFVAQMNELATKMGLQNTNFINCTGIYHQYHYTTCQDMAIIMAYAMKNPFCANVLSTEAYRTTTNIYPGGVTFYHDLLVTKFEEMKDPKHPIYIKTTTVTITAGKTGWVGGESGYCLVSYAKGKDGLVYVLVTAKAPQKNQEVVDHQNIYNAYVK
jgi:D-alanyl-D-alanine carboxypeptidase (penicillin-binding protein 5/6)